MLALREALGDKAFEDLKGLIVEKVKLFFVSFGALRDLVATWSLRNSGTRYYLQER